MIHLFPRVVKYYLWINKMNTRFPKIPRKDAKKILYQKIRDLYRLNYNYEEISKLLDVSKRTVFLALSKGRAKKKVLTKKS